MNLGSGGEIELLETEYDPSVNWFRLVLTQGSDFNIIFDDEPGYGRLYFGTADDDFFEGIIPAIE